MAKVDELLSNLREVEMRLEVLTCEHMTAEDALEFLRPVISYFEEQKKAAEEFMAFRESQNRENP